MVVDDIGDVWPCEILKDKFGNLRDHDFDINKLLEKYESKKLVKFIKDKNVIAHGNAQYKVVCYLILKSIQN